MKDSQRQGPVCTLSVKYIKANNERFSTFGWPVDREGLSISRRIMKDSQLM